MEDGPFDPVFHGRERDGGFRPTTGRLLTRPAGVLILTEQPGFLVIQRDVDKNDPLEINGRVVGRMLAEPEHVLKRILVVPSRHHKPVVGYVTVGKFLLVGVIDAIIPQTTIPAPSHHIKAAALYEPSTNLLTPLRGYLCFDDYYRPKGAAFEVRQGAIRQEMDVFGLHTAMIAGAPMAYTYDRYPPIAAAPP